MTISEQRFEQFCDRRGIPWIRIPERATKTPDYEVHVDGVQVAIEVKEIEPTVEDRALLTELSAGNSASHWVDMSRARQSILDAGRQLRAYAKGKQPAVVILYEVVALLGYLAADNIAHCLYGPEQVHVAVPKDPRVNTWLLGSSHGGRRVATEQHNTTLSAVAVLKSDGQDEELLVFHNAFAALPLEPNRFVFPGVRHFAWQVVDPGYLPRWVDVTSTTA